MNQIRYESPDSLSDVHDILAEYGSAAQVVAGGQTLMLMIRLDVVSADLYVDITDVPDLVGVDATENQIQIGAATTYSELLDHSVIEEIPGLGDAIKSIGDRQVRNMGTVGGALAHADPSLDIVPPLLCLDAELQISSADGSRTVPLQEFLVGLMETDLEADEVIQEIRFERPVQTGWGSSYIKRAPVEGGWPTVGVGARMRCENGVVESARVALAAVADTAILATALQSSLEGTPRADIDLEGTASAVTDTITPHSDHAGSTDYKEHLATVLTSRAIQTALDRIAT